MTDYRQEIVERVVKIAEKMKEDGYDIEALVQRSKLSPGMGIYDCKTCGNGLNMLKMSNMSFLVCYECRVWCNFQSGGRPTILDEEDQAPTVLILDLFEENDVVMFGEPAEYEDDDDYEYDPDEIPF